jgi:uncharacterized RmlC-like cupin family protein
MRMNPSKSQILRSRRNIDNTGLVVIAASEQESEGTHGFTRTWGITGTTTGSTGISMAYGKLPPGSKAQAHYHPFETAIYTIAGRARLFYGNNLEYMVDTRAGDFVFIPAGLVHAPESYGTEDLQFVVARTAAEDVYFLPGEGPAFGQPDAQPRKQPY